MKRKILSTLFMGAFLSATMSMFVSCKDYDDDINANATEIQALKTQLATLQTALEKAKADAAAAHATFATKGELEALKTEVAKLVTAEQLQKAIDECKAQLFDYVSSIDHLDWDNIDHERVAKPGFDTNELRAWDNASFEKWVKGELDGADVKRRHQLFVPSAGPGEQLSFDFDC